jgi:RND family efflux transporter MFP subunit
MADPDSTRPRALGALAALLISACGLSQSEAAPGREGAPAPARVEVAAVRDGTLTDRWVFLGEIQAMARASLAAGADGAVTFVGPRVGDRVTLGDELVKLDISLARARVAAAKASRAEVIQELAQAERDRRRAEQLGRSILPQAEIERDVTRAQTLTTRTSALQAAEREAKAQLHRHRVLAPFTGVIAARYVDPGDWVAPGDPVLELVDDEQVEIVVAASEDLLSRVHAGDIAVVRRGTERIDAEIKGVVRALDPATRTARLRLMPSQVPGWMLPGAVVDVEFAVVRDEEGVIVPRDALVYGAIGVRVIRVDEGKALPIAVDVLATVDDEALVRGEGLTIGDEVVVRGNERLRPGQLLEIGPPQG